MKLSSVRAGGRLDERGVALPLALFGLVAVSLLVTSALLTSSTELAISRAHQDGTRALYGADAALEEFVFERATSPASPDLLDSRAYETTSGSETYSLQVAKLFERDLAYPDSMERYETYSLVARKNDGRGRSVGALLEVLRIAFSVTLDIDSGLTLGTDATITGNATISDGTSEGAACDSAAAPAAIRHASGTEIHRDGGAHDIYGNIVEDELGSAELMEQVLNGRTIDELTDLASIRFGPMFDEPSFNNGNGPNQSAPAQEYRWGCPVQLVSGCTAEQASYFPSVVIDAEGGTIDITGDHGQGVIVVRNGDVHIRGNFLYSGIVLVEGNLTVTGTPRLEGAVVAMGDQAIIDPGDDSGTSGNSLIRFNRCAIVEAQTGLTLQALETADQRIEEPTFAWFEVVR